MHPCGTPQVIFNKLDFSFPILLEMTCGVPQGSTLPAVWDASPKSIDREGLRESRTGTRQSIKDNFFSWNQFFIWSLVMQDRNGTFVFGQYKSHTVLYSLT